MHRAVALLLCCCLLARGVTAAEPPWRPLFNGHDLSGWVNVNTAPSTWSVREGLIVCTGVPTGVLRTEQQFQNFVLELEWKHLHAGGNAGLFIHSDDITAPGVPFTRSIECQILDGNHGDLFAIHGAKFIPDRPHPKGWLRCLPNQERVKPAGEWNHYRVESRDGRITLAVNGEVVSGGTECKPRQGYICLESEGSEVHFRNIRLQELPSSTIPSAEVATAARGFRPLYNGLDLEGWAAAPEAERSWQPRDWILRYEGGAGTRNLWTRRSYGDFTLIADWRLVGEPRTQEALSIAEDGGAELDRRGQPRAVRYEDAGSSGILVRGSAKAQINIWNHPVGSGEIFGYRTDPALSTSLHRAATPRKRADNPLGEWNRFEITVAGDRLTVVLNGQTVIDRAHLLGLPDRGPIALQNGTGVVEFANLYVRELDSRTGN